MLQNVCEADQYRDVDSAQNQSIDQFLQVDGAGRIFLGMNAHMSVFTDGEIAFTPARYVVEVAGKLSGPTLGGFHHQGALAAVLFQCAPLLTLSVSFERAEWASTDWSAATFPAFPFR